MRSTSHRALPWLLPAAAVFAASSALAQGNPPAGAQQNPTATPQYVTVEEFDDAMSELDALRDQLGAARPGSQSYLLSGYARMGYDDTDGEPSTFYTSISPVFLWRMDKQFLFETELEVSTDEEGVALEYAQLSWTASDYVTIGVGKFLSPVGVFNERFHPAWINPLPNPPLLPGHSGFMPEALLGAQVRGNVPAGGGRLKYAFFVANGPELNDGSDDPMHAGMVEWEAGLAALQSKAIGGRVGFLLTPAMECGVSAMSSQASAAGTSADDTDAQLYGVDFSSVVDMKSKGTLRLLGEYAHESVGTVTYFPGTPSAVSFDNARDGAYGQVAWRPAGEGALSRLEGVVRFDWLGLPAGAPTSEDVRRWTAGVDYWLTERVVFKLAVDRVDSGGNSSNDILIQAAVGL